MKTVTFYGILQTAVCSKLGRGDTVTNLLVPPPWFDLYLLSK